LSILPIEFPVEGITDGVIRLRLQAEEDVGAMVASLDDPEIHRFTTVREGYDAVDARAWLDEGVQGMAAGVSLPLLAVDAESGALLGGVGGRRHHSDSERWTLGYLVYPEARGRGVAARAVRLLATYLFEELGAARIEVNIEPGNEASLRSAAAAGFQREGLQRAYQEIKGTRRDMVTLSLLPGEIIGGEE
jgi:RimJ/RimL family protein N-acetyltransferase